MNPIQDAISTLSVKLENMGFHYIVSQDPVRFARFINMSKRDDYLPISPVFNHEHAALGHLNFLWLALYTIRGNLPVASIAARLFEGNAIDLIRSGRLWYERKPRPVPDSHIVYDGPVIAGRFVYNGSLYIDKEYRGLGLARILPVLAVALANRQFEPHWHICLQWEKLAEPFATHVYRYTACAKCIDGLCPETGLAEDIWLCYISGADSRYQYRSPSSISAATSTYMTSPRPSITGQVRDQ